MVTNLVGAFARVLNLFIPVKQKHWVFGSDCGNMYREGSKYLLEYMLKHHPEYKCTFITRNRDVVQNLRHKGIPVCHNYSLRGLYNIVCADCVFTTQVVSDILYAYPKKNRRFYYLLHGQPFKVAADMLPKSVFDSFRHKSHSSNLQSYKREICHYLTVGYNRHDVDFVSTTSDFTASFLRREWKNVDVKVLGMPRNDALFRPKKILNEYWIEGLEEKIIVTYMPTHRKYGHGEVSPIPFLNNNAVQQWMRDHNVVLLIKQHPNMIKHHLEKIDSDVIVDISRLGFDPQVVIYQSDALITDYSSVWMDYLLLRRPLIFYFYDDFETTDVGCYYNLREEFPHNYCENESSLFDMIKKAILNPDCLVPSQEEVGKFHQYVDGNSCERYYEEIVKRMYGEE